MDGFEPERQDWVSRYRARRDVRRELRDDRRARRLLRDEDHPQALTP